MKEDWRAPILALAQTRLEITFLTLVLHTKLTKTLCGLWNAPYCHKVICGYYHILRMLLLERFFIKS